MANVEINDLAARTPAATDEVEVQQTGGGASGKSTWAQVLTFISSAAKTLTNTTIDGDNNTISNLDLGNEVDWAAAADVSDAGAFASGDKLLIFEIGTGLRKIDYDDLPGAGGGLSNIVEDTTPQLGGQLDVNGNAIGDGTLELLTFTEDASAVNHVNIENEATGSGPIISAAGDDMDIDLNLSGKGTGNIAIGNFVFNADATIGAGQDNYVLVYDDASGTWGPEALPGSTIASLSENSSPDGTEEFLTGDDEKITLDTIATYVGSADLTTIPLAEFDALGNIPPASNFATLDTRNNHPVLDFDASTNESAIFRGRLGSHYAGGGITVDLHVSLTSATTDDTDWDVEIERIGDSQQDIDSDSFAAANSTDNTTVPATSGFVDVISVTFTDGADMDSLAAGELFRIRVTRDAASDTATGDAELHRVVVWET